MDRCAGDTSRGDGWLSNRQAGVAHGVGVLWHGIVLYTVSSRSCRCAHQVAECILWTELVRAMHGMRCVTLYLSCCFVAYDVDVYMLTVHVIITQVQIHPLTQLPPPHHPHLLPLHTLRHPSHHAIYCDDEPRGHRDWETGGEACVCVCVCVCVHDGRASTMGCLCSVALVCVC